MLLNGKLINPEVRVETTNACNARCVICPRDKMTRPVRTMGNAAFFNIINQASALGVDAVSAFGFGEPLIDNGIVEKIEYCREMDLDTHITTNGSLLNDEIANALLDAGLNNIRFSIHAITPINHEITHRVSWANVYRNFLNFVHMNNMRGRPCTIHVSCIPMHRESVDDIRRVWEPLSDYLEIWRPHNWAVAKTFREVKPKKKTCGRPFNGPIQIQADGTVIPCCFLTNSEVVLGNVFENSLLEVLKGDEYERLRHAHATGNLSEYPCNSCDQLNVEMISPLLYSNRDPEMRIGVTSSIKKNVEGDF